MILLAAILSPAFIEGLGGPELMMIFFVILLLFGGQKLPELARGLGRSVREFKKASASVENEIKRAIEEPVNIVKTSVVPLDAPKQATPPSGENPAPPPTPPQKNA